MIPRLEPEVAHGFLGLGVRGLVGIGRGADMSQTAEAAVVGQIVASAPLENLGPMAFLLHQQTP